MDEKGRAIIANAYEVLGLSEDPSPEDVKTACDRVLRMIREDGCGWKRTKEIEGAFEILKNRFPDAPTIQSARRPTPDRDPKTTDRIRAIFFPPLPKAKGTNYWLRVCFLCFLAVWGVRFIFAPIEGDYVYRSFMHLVDLPFHEAGHLVFTFLGDFMHVLGGTLGQVIVPAVCAAAFLRQAEPFGASCCLWWTGQSFIDIAPYVYDARAGQLILLGGVTGQDNPCFHDWHNILGRLGLLSYDHALAYAAKFTGVLLIVLSLFWGAFVLFRQHGSSRESAASSR